jgi:hypothetical protein
MPRFNAKFMEFHFSSTFSMVAGCNVLTVSNESGMGLAKLEWVSGFTEVTGKKLGSFHLFATICQTFDSIAAGVFHCSIAIQSLGRFSRLR